MFYPHLDARDAPVLFFLLRRQFTATRLFGWLQDLYILHMKSLKSHVLI
jgi:hypothetical protein